MMPQGLREFYMGIEMLKAGIRHLKDAANSEHMQLATEYIKLAYLHVSELEHVCRVSLPSVKQHIDSALREVERGDAITAKELLLIARDKLWHYEEEAVIEQRQLG